jgi:nucleoside-diphosphate-sugar epimerase
MADYLVTGVAGFIASRVAEMLLEEGHQVFGVDNMNDAYDVRVKEFRLKRLMDKDGFTFKEMDISDREAVESIGASSGNLDAVFNLAARAGVRASVENPWLYVDTNITGTLNLLELCRRLNVPKFILASTSSVYGNDPPPAKEEMSSRSPLQPYAASKMGAETMCYAYHYLYDLDVTIFRYFTVYGPAGRPDMAMFRFIKWIVEDETVHLTGDGNQKRGFTYLDDIARGTVLGLKPVGYQIMNLGGHEIVSMNEVIQMIEKYVGNKAKIEHHPFPKADMLVNWADVTRAKEILEWEPQFTLEKGVPDTIDWYLENRDWASQLEFTI